MNSVETSDIKLNMFEGYGVFSKKQFDNCVENKKCECDKKYLPYIYYEKEDGEIVQVSEVFKTDKKSLFNDAIYLGKLVKFIGAYDKPL